MRGGCGFEVLCVKEVVDNGGASGLFIVDGGGDLVGILYVMLRSRLDDSQRSEK